MPKYDCLKCPGYCCSYPIIEVTEKDIARLARHFGIKPAEAKAKYTKKAHGLEAVLRRQDDPHFGRICKLFDTEKRRCTAYEGRPKVCRQFPGENRCGYYDFLSFEREHQRDKEFVATTDNGQFR